MSYAPHTNDHYANGADVPLLLGQFREKEYGHIFEYAKRPDNHLDDPFGDFAPEYPHVIYTGGELRCARVLSTVAHVVLDEAIDGSPVVVRWRIGSHKRYPTDWATARRAA